MTDTLTPKARSERMSRIRAKNSKPEMLVRRLAHGAGYRYRLHARELPGKPDLVFRPRKKVVFVHGCFWHRHAEPSCKLARLPKSRLDFWMPKLEKNVERDEAVLKKLEQEGWSALTVWECELDDRDSVLQKLKDFLQ